MYITSIDIILFVVFVMIVWLYKHHMENYHGHSYKSHSPKKVLATKAIVTRKQIINIVLASIVLILLSVCVLILCLSSDEGVLFIALIGATSIIVAEHVYCYLNDKVQWYMMIVKPTLDKITSEQDSNTVDFLMLLTKTNRTITQNTLDHNNQYIALRILNDAGLVCVRDTNIGNIVIAGINQIYRMTCRCYFQQHHKDKYRSLSNENLDDWLKESTIDSYVDDGAEHRPWNTECATRHQFTAQDIDDLSGPLSFANGAVELLIVAISIFSDKFSPKLLSTVFVSTIILMLIGYYNTKNKDRLLSVVGLIMSIAATFASVVALIISLIELANT